MNFNGKNVLILGSGMSGKGAAHALEKCNASVTILSSSELPDNIKQFDLVVVSPGIKQNHPVFSYAALHNLPILGEIGVGAIMNKAPVTAVTGTNGKTTTAGMLGSIYNAAGRKTCVCGNIGKSFAEAVSEEEYEQIVLELSSFQLLHSEPLKVKVGCITNIAEDHLDYHGNMFEYRHAKLRIADRTTPDEYLIIPQKMNIVGIRGNPTIIIRESCASCKNGNIELFGKYLMQEKELKVKGEHNLENAMNAALAAALDDVSYENIREGLMSYTPDKHRITFVCEVGGTSYYNDSKGTNISATIAATKCMKGRTALIVGGSDKGYDYDELFRQLPKQVVAIFVTGANSDRILRSAIRMGYKDIAECESLGEAVKRAAVGGFDSVLFSPASASFDRYSNYKERGDAFESEVRKYFEPQDI